MYIYIYGYVLPTNKCLLSLLDFFMQCLRLQVSYAQIWPGPGSLCFVLAGVCSFLATLISVGLEKELKQIGCCSEHSVQCAACIDMHP